MILGENKKLIFRVKLDQGVCGNTQFFNLFIKRNGSRQYTILTYLLDVMVCGNTQFFNLFIKRNGCSDLSGIFFEKKCNGCLV